MNDNKKNYPRDSDIGGEYSSYDTTEEGVRRVNNERTISQSIALVLAILSMVISVILFGSIILSANDNERTEELYKELHQ